MLASDPNSKSSAAALDIKIGSFHDPVHLQGRVCQRMSCKELLNNCLHLQILQIYPVYLDSTYVFSHFRLCRRASLL